MHSELMQRLPLRIFSISEGILQKKTVAKTTLNIFLHKNRQVEAKVLIYGRNQTRNYQSKTNKLERTVPEHNEKIVFSFLRVIFKDKNN
jgi:hypothetical protein